MNLMMLLEMAASGFGDRIAVQNGATKLSYQQLFDAAGSAARILRASGAERAAVLDVSSLAVPVGLFASAWAGVPFVPLNYRLTAEEVEKLLERIAPSYLVTEGGRVASLAHVARTTVVTRDAFLDAATSGQPGEPDW
ncbi:MAG: AMP-binding protein, partial [bacterium]